MIGQKSNTVDTSTANPSGHIYIKGDATTDDSLRICDVSGEPCMEKRVSGSWTQITEKKLGKLRRVDTGLWEAAQIGVEYYSPNQHGGIYGTIYRQYHGALAHDASISISGITKMVDNGGTFNGDVNYSGHTSDGTDHLYIYRVANAVKMSITTWLHTDGWVDYTK